MKNEIKIKAVLVLFMLIVAVAMADNLSRSWMVFILGLMALCVLTFEEYQEALHVKKDR